MSNLLSSSRGPSCLNCLRRTFLDDTIPAFSTPSSMQWRSASKQVKKKRPNRNVMMPIRLLKDTPRYGRKGALIGVPPATMRNYFFPSGRAAYLTLEEKRVLKGEIGERDTFYGVKLTGPETKEDQILEAAPTAPTAPQANTTPKASTTPKANTAQRPSLPNYLPTFSNNVSAARSLELLQKYVPERLDFLRTVLQTPPVTEAGKQDPNASAADVPTRAILGSVSTMDIAADIKRMMADGSKVQGDRQASRVVVEARDIDIVSGDPIPGSAGVEASGRVDRVRSLGTFDITIKIRGGTEQLKRRIRVAPLVTGMGTPAECAAPLPQA